MDGQKVLLYNPPANSSIPVSLDPVIHILSGSFRSLSLFLLAFSPASRSLSHVQTIDAYGPHQYLAANRFKDHIYTTSWALPPSLSSWRVDRSQSEGDPWRVRHVNTVPITATSSYISIPVPYTHAYSVGGPTGESHVIDRISGALGEKVQEVLFVPEDELETADKTRKALRYGSHGIEFTPSGRHAFVPVLGTNSIEMYSCDSSKGLLSHIVSVPSPRGEGTLDGPRHLKIHPNGKILYSITEHTNLVDAYRILPTNLEFLNSLSILPQYVRDNDRTHSSSESESNLHFRGDTLAFPPPTPSSPIPRVLITTTRGSTSDLRGWLAIFPLDEEGNLGKMSPDTLSSMTNNPNSNDDNQDDDNLDDLVKAEYFQTPTSGGKANAIDIISQKANRNEGDSEGLWILLTDDDDVTASASGTGAIRVLEWDGWGTGGVKIVAEWPSADDSPHGDRIQGASHAIWLD